MIQITLTLSSIAEAAALMAKLNGTEMAAISNTVIEESTPLKPIVTKAKPTEAPGKPAKPEAAPAPSQPTASEAAADAPAKSTEQPAPQASTAPDAGASSAAEPFEYRTLQQAVNARVAKHGKDALLAIARKHGAATFKELAAEKWEAAHNDVVALGG